MYFTSIDAVSGLCVDKRIGCYSAMLFNMSKSVHGDYEKIPNVDWLK